MITINHEQSHEYRTHRFVSTCSPCLLVIWVLAWFASTPLHASIVALSADRTLPQVDFAMKELRAALTTAGHTVTITGLDTIPNADIPMRIVMANQEQTGIIDSMRQQGASPSASLRAEGFSLRRTMSQGRVTYWIIGADAAGVMYGGLELAEIIDTTGLDGMQNDDQNPYMPLRGIKFNCPLDERTPTYSNHNGDSQRKNVLVMWDMDFWKAYIDDLARFRYNYLSLWNLHPFPSMVRVPGYEKVALDDVQSVTQTLKMTMDEKIAFWREVMRYAKDRNVDVYVVTWNIFITGKDGIYSTKGQYGLTPKFDNPVTTDYFRKSVKQLFLTYPDLAGIGLTTGERMPDLTTAQKEAWAFATYGQGVLDAAATQPGRKIRLIHRQHQTGAQDIARTFQPLLDHPDIDFIFSFKYAKAHVQSSTRQPYCNDFVKDIGNLKTIWTLRNDSNFYFRWGAPDFVREFIQNIPYDVSKGYYYGSDGYIWGREFLSKEPETPRQLEMAKHWYHWMLWGRLGYNPELSNDRFIQMLSAHFPQVPGRDLFTAWQEASMTYPLTTGFHWGSLDFQWYIEGCCSIPSYAQTDSGFHDINRFITLGPHPGTNNVSIPDYVEAVSSGEKIEGTTPIQVSQQLHASSDRALQILNQFPQVTKKELKRTLADIRAMAYLGKYYAHKIRGATELALYRNNKKEEHRSNAVSEMTQAASYWDFYTSTALKQYHNPIDLNRVILVDWQALRKDVQNDITIAGENLSQETAPAYPVGEAQSRVSKSLTERPPLGWNSYDCYGTSIKEAQFKACVDVLAEKLLPYGYNYAVIDAAWYNKPHRPGEEVELANNKEVFQIEMDEYSRQLPALERYPSAANGKGFKPLADYVHSKGMKFGIHIMRGIARQAVRENTRILGTSFRARDIVNLNSICPWSNKMYGVDVSKPGAQEYYNSLFDLYASWEIDFIKADDMMTPVYHKGEVEMMRKAIDQCGRQMVLSLSAGETPPSYARHLSRHANMWRISNDFWDRWGDVQRMFELAVTWSPFIGINNAWPDADMLPIGNLRIDHQNDSKWWRNEHLTTFSHDEITTVINLWCILRSPLMWGGDPVTTPQKYWQYLTNRELLEVNQNSHNNHQVYNKNGKIIWVADIPDFSSKYLAIFNVADNKQTVNFEFYWEGLRGPYVFRDLWKHAIVGEYSETFEMELAAHASVIYKVTPSK